MRHTTSAPYSTEDEAAKAMDALTHSASSASLADLADEPPDLVEVLVPAGAPMVSLDEGTVIQGIYCGAVDAVSVHGPGRLHYVLTAEGLVCTWGVYAVDQTLGRIARGTWIRLVGGPLEDLGDGRSMRLIRCWTSQSRSVPLDHVPALPATTVQVEGEP